MATCISVCQFVDYSQWFGCMVRDLEGAWLENWWQRHLGKRYLDRSPQIGKRCKDICVPCERSPKLTFHKTTLIIKWIGWSIQYIAVNLVSQPSLSLPNGFVHKVTIVASYGSATWTFTHQADLATATAECPICQQQLRLTLSPQYGIISQGD
jgi:hypothetical protein